MLLSCSNIVTLHDVDNNETKPLSISNKHKINSKVNSSVFNHNSRVIASAGEDSVINFYNYNLEYISSIDDSEIQGSSITSLAFNNNSNYLAYGSSDGHLKIWDLKTSNTQLNYKLNNNYITTMSFNNDSTHLTVGSTLGEIINFNMVTFSPTNFKFQSYFKCNQLKYSPLINNLIGTAFEDGSVKIIDIQTNEVVNNFGGFHQGSATGISFSPINKVFLCSVGLDSRVNFFDVSAKKHIKTLMTDHSLTGVSFHSEGQTIALSTQTGDIILYDLRYCNTPKMILKGHNSEINFIEFSKRNSKNNLNHSQTKSVTSTEPNININSANINMNNSNLTLQNNFLQNSAHSININNNINNNKISTTPNYESQLKDSSFRNNINLNNSNFKEKEYLLTSVEKKPNDSFSQPKEVLNSGNHNFIQNSNHKKNFINNNNVNNINSHNTMQVDNNFNSFANSSIDRNKIKITPLNLKNIEDIHKNEEKDQIDINLNNLDNKIQNLIKSSIETEMFKMKQFIHDEINSLHVDVIRQFEIQHSELIKSLKNFTNVNNKMSKELDKLKKENKDLKSQFF